MVKKFIKICLILCVIITISCSYSFKTNQYPDLKTIRIEPFENKSDESNIEVELFDMMVSQFNDDGRLSVVTQSPDVLLQGSVKSFKEEIHSSDVANNVEEYRIVIIFSIKMTDNIHEKVIYDGGSISLNEIYSVNNAETSAEYDNFEDAKNAIFEDLFDKIMQNTLEDW